MISFSRINLYDICPLQYNYRYIEQLETPEVSNKNALEKGSFIHFTLEDLNRIKYYNELLRFLEGHQDENTSDLKLISKYREYNKISEDFLNSELGQEIFKYKSLVEHEFYLDPDLKPIKKENITRDQESKCIKGFIDRVNFISKNQIELIDFKSGKYKDPKYQSYLQLIIYAIYILQRLEHLDSINLRFVYIEYNKENAKVFSRREILRMIPVIKEKIQKMISDEENKTFEARVQKLCDFCDFRSRCKAFSDSRNSDDSSDFINSILF